jgi:hypothetical protein
MNPSIVPSNPSKPMVTDACGSRHYILVNITRCAVWRLFCYQSVSADLTAPLLQLGPCRRSPTRADLDSRTPTIIVLPVSCPVVPLGPSQWRVGRRTRGRWHKSRHQRARKSLSSMPLQPGVKIFAHASEATGLALQSSAHASVCGAWPGLSLPPAQQRAARRETYSAEQIEQYCTYGDC